MIDVIAVDAGNDGGWEKLAALCDLRVLAFDPLDGPLPGRYLLGSGTKVVPFYVNRTRSGSSTYPLNRALTDRWRWGTPRDGNVTNVRDAMVEERTEMETTCSLDAWCKTYGVPRVDFLRMNVQGAELDVLDGANRLLPDVLGILTEVAFVESYVGRPLFADVDRRLRHFGFTFFDLTSTHYVGRAASPVFHGEVEPGRPVGQLVEAHALYLRDPAGLEFALTALGLRRLAIIAEAFGQLEFAREIIA